MIKSPKYYLQTAKTFGWAEGSTLDKERLELLKTFVSGRKILDVGSAYGMYVDYLVSEGFDAYGVDFVSEFILNSKKTKKGEFVKARADKLPFKNKEFETAILFDILEHGDDLKILSEAKRVTKKRILIIVPKIVDHDLEQGGVIFRHYIDKSHLREYTKESLRDLINKVGLKVVYIREVHPLYNETIFLSLFSGPRNLKKIIRKLVFFILPKKKYTTEIFSVVKI